MAGLKLTEKEHVVDQLPHLIDLSTRQIDELVDVGAGKLDRLDERKKACERRSQLVRNRGREPGTKLFIGVHVAWTPDVHQTFDAIADDQWHLENLGGASPITHRTGQPPTMRDVGIGLACAATGVNHAVVGIEQHDHLAALLDQQSATQGPQRLFAACHHSFTRYLPVDDPLDPTVAPQCRDMSKVLVIEDDELIGQGMVRHLTAAGFDATWVGKGETGLARLRFERPDVCVLDLMLPGIDGWRLIETARGEGIGIPIIVVSARGTEHDRVHALEIGADDYLVKPFSMKELIARVQAASRRGPREAVASRGDLIEVAGLRIDPDQVQAYVDGVDASLTPTEFRLLYTLAREHGRVLTRDDLLQRVWGRPATHRDRTVDVFVRRLREKIDRLSSTHTYIQTRYGVGYKLEAEPK